MEAEAMLNPNERVLKAMAALRHSGQADGNGNPHFEVFLAWLRRLYLEQSERNNSERTEVLLRMGQGRAMALAELVKVLENAPCDTQ
jgi:hypothetical protein